VSLGENADEYDDTFDVIAADFDGPVIGNIVSHGKKFSPQVECVIEHPRVVVLDDEEEEFARDIWGDADKNPEEDE